MAKNVQGVIFLRNNNPYASRNTALTGIESKKSLVGDGQFILARYNATESGATVVKTLVGVKAGDGANGYLTIIDVEGASADVEALRQEINAKLGDGVGSGASETVTAQLTALSGNSQSTSAETSVEGAKRYADELKNQMDYTGVTTGDGVYVTNVTQSDGIVSATTAVLPSVTDTKEAKKVVISVSEDKGEISIERGTISSSAETMVLTDNTDGGVNFEVNIDGVSIVQDTTSKKLKVADTALTQYYGDEKTVHAEVDSTNNTKTFSTLLKIVKNANPSETEVKEEYYLADADGTAITGADTIKIYKDSHIVSITYITDSGDTHYQNLEYKYIDASGVTKTEYVDISSLVLEAEFASGLTIENHVARGVVDPQSEKDSENTAFLTVGADGFKISGIKDEIDRKLNAIVEDLDATVTGATSGNHVTITIDEVDGKLTQSGLTIEENDIASAADLAALSAKTVTALTSTNGSITASIDDAAGCKTYDIITDADKIQMSGFTAAGTSSLSGIAESDSIATAFEKTNAVITENERVTAEALTDLDTRVDTISGDVDTIKEQYISGVSVNSVAVTPANKVAPISISGSTAAPSGTVNDPAIIVNTNQQTGAITLGIGYIDCGTYDDPQP